MKLAYQQNFLAYALVSVLVFTSTQAADITPADACAIAKEAYIYGFPLVNSYYIMHAYVVDRANSEYKAEVESSRNDYQ